MNLLWTQGKVKGISNSDASIVLGFKYVSGLYEKYTNPKVVKSELSLCLYLYIGLCLVLSPYPPYPRRGGGNALTAGAQRRFTPPHPLRIALPTQGSKAPHDQHKEK